MAIRHFLQFSDFSLDEFAHVIERARIIKHRFKNYEPYHPLEDRTLVMVFEKNSTRTRLSFEAGMHQLGGAAIYLNTRDSQLGRGEPVEDAAQVMSRMCDIIMIRTFGQEIIERFAAHSRVPVINGLTNEHHPCQVLADVFTYIEHRGSIAGKTVAWIGDANNMLYSWLQAADVFGFHLNVSTPKGYDIVPALVSPDNGRYTVFADPSQACDGADLVTTDVWTSMGYEEENATRLKAFNGWIVDTAKMARAKPQALFMHCLPAHRGEEVAAEVIDGPQSVVWDEAENRLHVQKALLEYLVLGRSHEMTQPSVLRSQTRHATVLFAVLMGMVMTFIVTCVVTAVNTGVGGGFFLRWMRAFVFAWPVASTCILIFAHRVRRLVDRIIVARTENAAKTV